MSERLHEPAPAPCGRRFPEELLSGYLDRALTQGEHQRVRVHLEDCAACRGLLAELAALRETAMNTRFLIPADDQWNERPRGGLSRVLRGGGWLVATAPESLFEKLLIFGGASGGALLFLSALVDRLRALPGDRYRRVEK